MGILVTAYKALRGHKKYHWNDSGARAKGFNAFTKGWLVISVALRHRAVLRLLRDVLPQASPGYKSRRESETRHIPSLRAGMFASKSVGGMTETG